MTATITFVSLWTQAHVLVYVDTRQQP